MQRTGELTQDTTHNTDIIKLSAYNHSVIKEGNIDEEISIEELYNRIIDPNFQVDGINIKDQCEKIRQCQEEIQLLLPHEDLKNHLKSAKDNKSKLKYSLGGCYITTYKPPSFPKKGFENNKLTGLVVLDYDDYAINYDDLKEKLKQRPEVVMFFNSPAFGLKVIVDTNIAGVVALNDTNAVLNDTSKKAIEVEFKEKFWWYYKPFSKELDISVEVDKAPVSNIYLITYYSHDSDAYLNPNYTNNNWNPTPAKIPIINPDQIASNKTALIAYEDHKSKSKNKSKTTDKTTKNDGGASINDSEDNGKDYEEKGEEIADKLDFKGFKNEFNKVWEQVSNTVNRSRIGEYFNYTMMRDTIWWARKYNIWELWECKAYITIMRPVEDESITGDKVESIWGEYNENRAVYGWLFGVDILHKLNPDIKRNQFYKFFSKNERRLLELIEKEDIFYIESEDKIYRREASKESNGIINYEYSPYTMNAFFTGQRIGKKNKFALIKVLEENNRKKLKIVSSFREHDNNRYLNTISRENWLIPSEDIKYHALFDIILDSLSDGDIEARKHIEHVIAWKYLHPESFDIPALCFNGAGNAGKNCFVSTILEQIFTKQMVTTTNASVFSSDFNGELAGKAVVMIDESDLSKAIQARIKSIVGNKTIKINVKYGGAGDRENTAMYIFASNNLKGSVELSDDGSSRRFSPITLSNTMAYYYAKHHNLEYHKNTYRDQALYKINDLVEERMRGDINLIFNNAVEVSKWLGSIVKTYKNAGKPMALRTKDFMRLMEVQKDNFEVILDYIFTDPNFTFISSNDCYEVYRLYMEDNNAKKFIRTRRSFDMEVRKYIERNFRNVKAKERTKKRLIYFYNNLKQIDFEQDVEDYYFNRLSSPKTLKTFWSEDNSGFFDDDDEDSGSSILSSIDQQTKTTSNVINIDCNVDGGFVVYDDNHRVKLDTAKPIIHSYKVPIPDDDDDYDEETQRILAKIRKY